MYVSRQKCPLHLFKLLFEVSLERFNHLRQDACTSFHFSKQQGATVTFVGAVKHMQPGQDAPVEGAFDIPAPSTCKSDPVTIILNLNRSFLPIHCYKITCITIIQ